MSSSESTTSEDERVPPQVSWIYRLKKPQLKEALHQFNLSVKGPVKELRTRLRENFLNHPEFWDTPISQLINPRLSQDTTMQGETKDQFPSTPLLNQTFSPQPYLPLPYLISSWNLKFNNSCGLSPVDFLLRIGEKKKSYAIPDATLFTCLPEFLEGIPLNWYRLNHTLWTKWDDFEKDFRRTFFPRDYQEKLKREIETRTQGEYECISDFVICLRTLMSKLDTPLAESHQISRIYDNLRPPYQMYFRRSEVNSILHIIALGQEYESYREKSRTFRPPPPKESVLVPEAAYQPPLSSHHSQQTRREQNTCSSSPNWLRKGAKPQSSPINTIISNRRAKHSGGNEKQPIAEYPKMRCWNCSEVGHNYAKCLKKRKQFCYRCGKPDYTINTCPNCTPPGNEERAQTQGSVRAPEL